MTEQQLRNKILVVHPRTMYDPEHRTRDIIRRMLGSYTPNEIYVLSDTTEDDHDNFREYLGRSDLEHALVSRLGSIKNSEFLDDLFVGLDELTLVGHTGGECHHTAYEEVITHLVQRTHRASLKIRLPIYAINLGFTLGDGTSIAEYVQLLAPKASWAVPLRLRYYTGTLASELSEAEKLILQLMANYTTTLFTQQPFLSFDVFIDERKVFCYDSQKEKRVDLHIESKEI